MNEKKTLADEDITSKMAQRSPKKILEKDIQREICDWLHGQGTFFWRSNNVPIFEHGGKGGARFRAMPKYAVRGLPDIMCLCNGRFIGLEVKVPDYWKRTDEQIAVKDLFINNGGYYTIVTSLEEAKSYMTAVASII